MLADEVVLIVVNVNAAETVVRVFVAVAVAAVNEFDWFAADDDGDDDATEADYVWFVMV